MREGAELEGVENRGKDKRVSDELLGLEKGAQVARLPEAHEQQRRHLRHTPPEHTRRRRLAQVAEALLALLCSTS